MASRLHSAEESAALVARWRAEGKMPPQGQHPENVPQSDNRIVNQSSVRCEFLGDVIHQEPCTCGASSKIAIHACQHDERKRRSGDPGTCVPQQSQLNRVKDKDVRTVTQCCEKCPLRTISETRAET